MKALCLVIVALTAADSAKHDTTNRNAENLKGTWMWVSAIADGKPKTDDDLKAGRVAMVFDGASADVTVGGNTTQRSTYRIDPTKTPKEIDLTIKDYGETCQGIYVLDGDYLRLCYTQPGMDRPTEFVAKRGNALIVLKRKKP
jgi:uncharacterized protein (TIGR03067 family)